MEAPLQEDTIFEEREELMVSPAGGTPTLRAAHFLSPTVASIDGPPLKLPKFSLASESKWPLKVTFHGWRNPFKTWKTWVDRMHSVYQNVWKQAGIYEAVMGSTYKIHKNNYLVFGVSERWCSETNTFWFPWGEATITLEDIMILGGFSVLGCPVSLSLETKELVDIEENLNKVYKDLVRSNTQEATHAAWLNQFMGSGSKFEQEAFLSLWLSRFVFPGNVYDTISKHVFPIAIRLARGTRIALAPAVLASLYRDLRTLKQTIVAASVECEESFFFQLSLWSPFQFVQIWAWERLLPLQPNPNFLNFGEMRLARWHDLKKFNPRNIRLDIDSAAENFLWRPYAIAIDNWMLPKFYKEKEEWVSGNLGLDEELESFGRCLRVSKLVGIDCMELYLPHRVAMQFGIDQDLPGWVPPSNLTPEIAWQIYSRSTSDAKLYFPARLFESDVTNRYLKWWKDSVLAPLDLINGFVRRPRSSRRSKRLLQHSEGGKGENSKERKRGNDSDVPPGFPPKCLQMEGNQQTWLHNSKERAANYADVPFGFPPKCFYMEGNRNTLLQNLKRAKRGNIADFPPGFQPKRNLVDEIPHTLMRMLQTNDKNQSDEKKNGCNDKKLSAVQFQSSSSLAMSNETFRKGEWLVKPVEKINQTETAKGGLEVVIERVNCSRDESSIQNTGSINRNEGGTSSFTVDIAEFELEARISNLERIVAGLLAEEYGNEV